MRDHRRTEEKPSLAARTTEFLKTGTGVITAVATLLVAVTGLVTAITQLSGDDETPAGPPAATVSVANLSALRWIQGSWRAERTLGGQTLFFERYTFADESTLVVESYAVSAVNFGPAPRLVSRAPRSSKAVVSGATRMAESA